MGWGGLKDGHNSPLKLEADKYHFTLPPGIHHRKQWYLPVLQNDKGPKGGMFINGVVPRNWYDRGTTSITKDRQGIHYMLEYYDSSARPFVNCNDHFTYWVCDASGTLCTSAMLDVSVYTPPGVLSQ
jgi:hypothetical protein